MEEVTTPCTGLSAARTRNLVHYEVNSPRFLKANVEMINLRMATVDDMPAVMDLITELAIFEKAADQVTNTVEQFEFRSRRVTLWLKNCLNSEVLHSKLDELVSALCADQPLTQVTSLVL